MQARWTGVVFADAVYSVYASLKSNPCEHACRCCLLQLTMNLNSSYLPDSIEPSFIKF